MKRIFLLILLVSLVFLTGCWDKKILQNVNYVTALGIDFKDGQYTIYTQLIKFSTVSKESSAPGASTWVGVGKGPSVMLAMGDMYKVFQQKTEWAHVKAVILSENVLNSDLDKLREELMRFREIRYIPWVFGTNSDVQKILMAGGMFDMPSFETLLEKPEELYKQSSYFVPIRLQKFVYSIREPATTLLLPNLSLNDQQVRDQKEKKNMLEVKGSFAIYKNKSLGLFSDEQLLGLRWSNNKTYRSSVVLKTGDQVSAMIMIEQPKAKMQVRVIDDKPAVNLAIKVDGFVNVLNDALTENNLKTMVADQIKDEIVKSMNTGVSKGVDLLNVQENLYRKHLTEWKQLTKEQPFNARRIALDAIEVDVDITHSSSYTIEKIQNR